MEGSIKTAIFTYNKKIRIIDYRSYCLDEKKR